MTTVSDETVRNPRIGMLAIIRKRRAVISEVKPFSGDCGVLNLVRLDYLLRRLREDFSQDQERFNDPEAKVRVLVAAGAARRG